jgi:hypothetical protein
MEFYYFKSKKKKTLSKIKTRKYLNVAKKVFLLFFSINRELPIILLLVRIKIKFLAFSALKVENITVRELISINPTKSANI